MTYGSLIKQSREDLRLTQEQLAEQLDVSRQAVSKWEADLSRPTREKLGRLSEILNIPPDAWAQADAEIRAAAHLPLAKTGSRTGGPAFPGSSSAGRRTRPAHGICPARRLPPDCPAGLRFR